MNLYWNCKAKGLVDWKNVSVTQLVISRT